MLRIPQALAYCLVYLVTPFICSAERNQPMKPGADKPKLFLCLDSATVAGKQKLVYAYVDGQKTECMPENELLTMINKARHAEEQAAQREALGLASSPDATKHSHGKNLIQADLRGHDFKDADLSSADLRGALLARADLRKANCQGANFTGADLRNTYFKHANLQAANLTQASLGGAWFVSSDLRGAHGLTLEQVKYVQTFYQSRMDSTFLRSLQSRYPDKLKKPRGAWGSERLPKNGKGKRNLSAYDKKAEEHKP
ncbi:MAG: hypothetical protein GF398_18825 [Chitinivibrionales bacterium]|nr:hypothetical protein [Chitinivibrionales bacterium]